MSVLLRGMRMPKNCTECDIRCYDANEGEEYCPITDIAVLNIGRQDNCPLVELPERHGRLFDTDEVVKCLEELPDCNEKAWAIGLVEWAIAKRWCIEAEGEE